MQANFQWQESKEVVSWIIKKEEEISQVYPYSELTKLYTLNQCNLLYVITSH